jgi:hypothetical protein
MGCVYCAVRTTSLRKIQVNFHIHIVNVPTNQPYTELCLLHIIHPVVLQYIKLMLNFVQSNTTYFSGGNMFRLTNKSSSGHPVT